MPAKPPSWNQLRDNAQEFVSRWVGTTSERGEAQSFWNEFLGIFGIDRKRVAVFEKLVKRTSTGKDGRIDLYFPGILVAEHKSAGLSLEEAEKQAIDYLDDLGEANLPKVVLTSDFDHIRILDISQPGQEAVTIKTADLPKELDRFAFIAGYRSRRFTAEQETAANINAAKIMGRLYEQLALDGYSEHNISVLLARLLFLMFGDDSGLWAKGLFHELIETRTAKDGSDTGAQLAALFQTVNTPEERRSRNIDEALNRFPYINGGLFEENIRIPFFDQEMRDELLRACAFDWVTISPAIFGSMFQAVKDKDARRELGEHYTTETNIMKVISPLFLDELVERFEAARHNERRLRALRNELGTYQFLDPACGCGNFLIVAYRELRRLEFDILVALRELSGDHQLALDVSLDLAVKMEQFHGIEVDEWAAQIAETAMFLVDQQENLTLAQEFGDAPDRLPITTSATIRRGNAIRLDWLRDLGIDEADRDRLIILGNPPFIGMAYMKPEQQEDNRLAFAGLDTAGLRTGRLDYVASWYAKAVALLRDTKGRAAFVSTNSITQGEQARSMVPLLSRHGFEVDFGHRTFLWTSEAPGAASVHVVIVGFSPEGGKKRRRLYEYPSLRSQPVERTPKRLNFYLSEGEDIVPVKLRAPAVPGMPFATKGSQPTDGGHLLIDPDKDAEGLEQVRADPIASRYLVPFIQGKNMLDGEERWCLWLEGATPGELRSSPELRKRLAAVAEARGKSPTASVREQAMTPALFTQRRQPTERYFALPEVSSGNRQWVPGRFLEPDHIAGNKLIVFPGAELWHFGYLQSSIYMAWLRTFAGRLKSDISISPALAYFPFPFLPPEGRKRSNLEEAAAGVLDAREEFPEASLAELYDPLVMPKSLLDAHRKLDVVVDGFHSLRKPLEADRLRAILRDYERVIAPLTAPLPKSRKVRV